MQGEAINLGLALRVTVRRYFDFINPPSGTRGPVGMSSNLSKGALTERRGRQAKATMSSGFHLLDRPRAHRQFLVILRARRRSAIFGWQ
jgi:hypothetical protein